MKLSVLMPVYNEIGTIAEIVKLVEEALPDRFHEGHGMIVMEIDTNYVRSKKSPRFLDFRDLVRSCGASNC
jgi:hypothetical protein